MIHSSTLGFSPPPPVSVYGTGRHTLDAFKVFLQVWLPALSARPKARGSVTLQVTPLRFNVLFRQHAAVSLPGPSKTCMTSAGILTGSPSTAPLGFALGPDLP